MIQAFYTGIVGVQANQTAIDVTANDLANIDKLGYRGYTPEFSSLFNKAIHTDNPANSTDNYIGIGSQINTITLDTSPGAYQDTPQSTDLAIFGDGWFAVSKGEEIFYTRAGDFTFDKNRDIVNRAGMYLLGTIGSNIDLANKTLLAETTSTPLGTINEQQKLQFPETLTYPAKPTDTVNFFGNLGIEDETRIISGTAIDAYGNKNRIKLLFTKSQTQPQVGSSWDIQASAESNDGSIVYSTTSGVATFDGNGALTSSTLTTIDNNGTQVSLDLGQNFSGVVAIDNFPISASSQSNGLEAGELVGYELTKDAEIIAVFSNGRQSSVGRVGVFHFQNDQGLEAVSASLFQETQNSGKPIVFKDADGNNILGAIVKNYTLEVSNVRMDEGLTNLLVLQRSYDANAKSITTADQMIQKALNMDA